MPVEELTAQHYRAQQLLARRTVTEAQALWSQVKPTSVLDSWLALLADVILALIGGQRAAARMAQPYLDALADEQGLDPADLRINPVAFSGVAADGRDLRSLLVQPALRALGLLGAGADERTAMLSGLESLTRIVDTEISDASRAADHTGMVANKGWVTYVRHVSLPACGRCIILAGRTYSWSTGFLRHPRCDCSLQPAREGDTPPASPQELFEQMPEPDQRKAFTVAGAEAIRLGADLGQVVNARRGMTTTADGRKVTTEGTTRRGVAGRRMGARGMRKAPVRLMPEQILEDAAGDRDEAVRLLKRFGYLA